MVSGRNVDRVCLYGVTLLALTLSPGGCLINPKDYPLATNAIGGETDSGQAGNAVSLGGDSSARGGTTTLGGNGGSAAHAGSSVGAAGGTPSVAGGADGAAPPIGGSAEVGGEAGNMEPQGGTGGRSDGGTSPSLGGTGGTGGTTPSVKRVFVTSKTFTGDFTAYASSMDPNGLNGANIVCNQAASEAALGGQWVAWLSVTGNDAIHRVNDVAPWYLVDRTTKAFDTHDQLAASANALVNMSEYGDVVAGPAWTGTTLLGVAHSARCGEWTNEGNSLGAWGDTGNAFDWSFKDTNRCSTMARLYCFEQ